MYDEEPDEEHDPMAYDKYMRQQDMEQKAAHQEWLHHKCIHKVTDYKPQPIEMLKANWGAYDVTVQLTDGTTKTGSMQGDTHNWAFETFEES